MPPAAALAARCGFLLSPQLHRGISASGPALPGAAQPYGTASMLDPSRPELEFRIHPPPAGSHANFRFLRHSPPGGEARSVALADQRCNRVLDQLRRPDLATGIRLGAGTPAAARPGNAIEHCCFISDRDIGPWGFSS